MTDYKYNSEKIEKVGTLRQSKSKSFFTSIFKQSAYKSLTQSGNIVDLNKQSQPNSSLVKKLNCFSKNTNLKFSY